MIDMALFTIHGRRSIVRDDSDRQKRLHWLERTVGTYGWKLHAFVVMNHDHLLVETPEPNLSTGMQFLNGSYSGYFNARHRRVGHLFQGRFKAQLIEEEGHYREISRYIHLNPCRVRGRPLASVSELASYPWCSYPGYHRASKIVSRIKELLDTRPADRAVPELNAVRAKPHLEQIIKVVLREFGQDEDDPWCVGRRADDASRAVAAHLARRRYGYSAKSVAKALGYSHPSSVSHAVRRIDVGSATLKQTVNRVERKLMHR